MYERDLLLVQKYDIKNILLMDISLILFKSLFMIHILFTLLVQNQYILID